MTGSIPLVRGRAGTPPVRVAGTEPRREYHRVHGYRRSYLRAGSGPPLLLLHGIGDSSETWREVIPLLARDHTVIAPDMLGNGRSDNPRADYSVAAFANGVRDLLGVLGIERATIVGHSLGGGVAMQFTYQYPHVCERLVLVSTGGLGREVTPVLRAVTLPNADLAMALLRTPGARIGARIGAEVMRRTGTSFGHDAADFLRVVESVRDATSRSALVRTVRSVVDWRGQVITMLDRAYLARAVPTLILWGGRDTVIPVAHAEVARAALPGSRLEVFEGAGHFPHRSDPERFVAVLRDFLARNEPAAHDPEHWRELLRGGRPDDSEGDDAARTEDAIVAGARSGT